MQWMQTGKLDPGWYSDVRELQTVDEPIALRKNAFLVVRGDLQADVTMPDGGNVIVYGDLRASIYTNGIGDVVIAGSIEENGSVSVTNIIHLFVGGNMRGAIRSTGSCDAWVLGDLTGDVFTGEPSSEIHVLGDFTGRIQPSNDAALLYLVVGRYMPYAVLENAGKFKYTDFVASIGSSDRPPGIYPDRAAHRKFRHLPRWVIRGNGIDAEFRKYPWFEGLSTETRSK